MTFKIGDRVRERESVMVKNHPFAFLGGDPNDSANFPQVPMIGTVSGFEGDDTILVDYDAGQFAPYDKEGMLDGWPYDASDLELLDV